jgi:hypothetical protein
MQDYLILKKYGENMDGKSILPDILRKPGLG